jgi:enamine deaminase RidA (YjgF/YER057c/UK114 family)
MSVHDTDTDTGARQLDHGDQEPPAGAVPEPDVWIAELLVDRDIAAFVAGDWDAMASDFDPDGFVGLVELPHTARVHVTYPDLGSYRAAWLSDSAAVRAELPPARLEAELRDATRLAVEVSGDHAVARKVIDGVAGRVRYQRVVEYRLRSVGRRWRVIGFTCHLGAHDDAANSAPTQSTLSGCGHRVPAGAHTHSGSGPYSPVLIVGGGELVAISGQGPLSADGEVIGATIEEQTSVTMENCRRQLAAAGCTFRDVWKVTIYLADLAEWQRMNVTYAQYFEPPRPVRATVGAALLLDMKIEIEMLATRPAGLG